MESVEDLGKALFKVNDLHVYLKSNCFADFFFTHFSGTNLVSSCGTTTVNTQTVHKTLKWITTKNTTRQYYISRKKNQV